MNIQSKTLAKAKELGADYIINSKLEDPVKKILDLTTTGADVAVDALGSEITSNQSILSLKRRGKHIQLGLLLTEDGLTPMAMARVIGWELELIGSHGMAAVDYPQLLQMIAEGKLHPEKFIKRTISLEDATNALANMENAVQDGITIIKP